MHSSFNKDKFENVLLYILKQCSSKPSFGKTVLYKLLYFSDFNFYELFEKPLTGETYRKIDLGPAPVHINDVIESLKSEGKIKHIRTEYYGKRQDRFIPISEPDLSKITAEEIKAIDYVIGKLSDMNAQQASEYSHNDVPFKSTPDREIIDYELVFYRTPAYSIRQYPQNNAVL